MYGVAVIASELLLRANIILQPRNQWSIWTVFGMVSEQAIWN